MCYSARFNLLQRMSSILDFRGVVLAERTLHVQEANGCTSFHRVVIKKEVVWTTVQGAAL